MIAWSLHDDICELVLDAPPCNEIGREMLTALEGFVTAFSPSDCRALIMRSAQPAGFCAGADLRELYETIRDRGQDDVMAELRDFLDRIHAVMNALDALPVPTIGVVHGVCFGGGFELALTCDVLIAERTARFAFPELRLGLIPGFGGIPRLRRDVGNALIRDLLFAGRSINAKRAQEVGLVSQVVQRDRGLDAARALGRQISRLDAETVRTSKSFAKPIPYDELEAEKETFLEMFRRPAVREGLRAFYESQSVRPYLA